MKLTDAELEEGRAFIHTNNISGLMSWVDEHRIIIKKDMLRETMTKLINANCHDRAIKLFDATFVDCDPQLERAVVKVGLAVRLTVILVVLLGCIGGIVYLFRSIF
jgi:hypothetical protein